jgi:hypothetical protein
LRSNITGVGGVDCINLIVLPLLREFQDIAVAGYSSVAIGGGSSVAVGGDSSAVELEVFSLV